MPPSEPGNPLILIVFIVIIFYFIVFRPEKKAKEERKQKLAKLKKNDSVVTLGGIHGTVVNVKETTVIVRVDDNVKLEVDKEAITTIESKNGNS